MNTRKYPRTLDEAFGPHTHHKIENTERPMDWQDKVVVWGSIATAAICLLLVLSGVIL